MKKRSSLDELSRHFIAPIQGILERMLTGKSMIRSVSTKGAEKIRYSCGTTATPPRSCVTGRSRSTACGSAGLNSYWYTAGSAKWGFYRSAIIPNKQHEVAADIGSREGSRPVSTAFRANTDRLDVSQTTAYGQPHHDREETLASEGVDGQGPSPIDLPHAVCKPKGLQPPSRFSLRWSSSAVKSRAPS